jgi:hypothetical protein
MGRFKKGDEVVFLAEQRKMGTGVVWKLLPQDVVMGEVLGVSRIGIIIMETVVYPNDLCTIRSSQRSFHDVVDQCIAWDINGLQFSSKSNSDKECLPSDEKDNQNSFFSVAPLQSFSAPVHLEIGAQSCHPTQPPRIVARKVGGFVKDDVVFLYNQQQYLRLMEIRLVMGQKLGWRM